VLFTQARLPLLQLEPLQHVWFWLPQFPEPWHVLLELLQLSPLLHPPPLQHVWP
jgi:hypothetical protein